MFIWPIKSNQDFCKRKKHPPPMLPHPTPRNIPGKMFAFTLKTTWMVNGNTSYLLNLVYHTNKLSENFLYSNRPALKSVPSKLCLLLLWLVLYKEKLIVKDSQGKGNLSWSGIERYKWVPGIYNISSCPLINQSHIASHQTEWRRLHRLHQQPKPLSHDS